MLAYVIYNGSLRDYLDGKQFTVNYFIREFLYILLIWVIATETLYLIF